MPPKKHQQSAPVIAQLITEKIISYELEVFSHKGFLAQLRTRGIGPPQPVFRRPSDPAPYKVEYAAYEDYFFPLLNDVALARRGLKRAEVEEWLKMPGNDGFTHPECVPLCLRWGQNAEGIFAKEYVAPAGNPDNQVEFIPYSCKQSGLTYYCLCYDDDSFQGSRCEKELKSQEILREHTEQIGSEGYWRGWYSTDLVALQKALSSYRLSPVLVQYITEYGVVYFESSMESIWGEHYYLKSEAEARYAEFPEDPAYDSYLTNEYPRLIKGTSYSVRGRPVHGGRSGEKVLFKPHLA
ncbi:MAG: hypothetical protein ACRYG7_06800 [Janthinobacterium lividum]